MLLPLRNRQINYTNSFRMNLQELFHRSSSCMNWWQSAQIVGDFRHVPDFIGTFFYRVWNSSSREISLVISSGHTSRKSQPQFRINTRKKNLRCLEKPNIFVP